MVEKIVEQKVQDVEVGRECKCDICGKTIYRIHPPKECEAKASFYTVTRKDIVIRDCSAMLYPPIESIVMDICSDNCLRTAVEKYITLEYGDQRFNSIEIQGRTINEYCGGDITISSKDKVGIVKISDDK